MPRDYDDALEGRPRLIFSTELEGPALLRLLDEPGLVPLLARYDWSVAIGLPRFDEAYAAAARRLLAAGVPLVAWLMPHPDDGIAFSAQNYPQARTSYQAFLAWVRAERLAFEAVGLDIAPPPEVVSAERLSARYMLQRFWRAGDNVLFPAARAAYAELAAAIRHDGYELHAYQWPVIADDRRAGTTLVQRALEIADLPADLDVLVCAGSLPIEWFGGDLGGALVAAYGPGADAISVTLAPRDGDGPGDPWPAARRDLLLAARHTDIIYLDSLEAGVEAGLLARIAALDWESAARAARLQRVAVGLLRAILFAGLTTARFGPRALAWAGWALAGLLWLQLRRARRTPPL